MCPNSPAPELRTSLTDLFSIHSRPFITILFTYSKEKSQCKALAFLCDTNMNLNDSCADELQNKATARVLHERYVNVTLGLSLAGSINHSVL